MSQKSEFFAGEADAWFERNPKTIDCERDPVMRAIRSLGITPQRVLEIGCGGGFRLECFRAIYGCECQGIDPSRKAVQRVGLQSGITLRQGTADALPGADHRFDLVMLGFCLYLCDPADYFRIAAEADRVLQSPGFLVISDFLPPVPYRNPYLDRREIFSRKMEWSRMFLWNPSYRLLSRTYFEQGQQNTFAADESAAVDILRKDAALAFPDNPY